MKKNIIIIIIIFLFFGCTVDYDVNLKNMGSDIVIIGQVCDTLAHQKVIITQTNPYYSSDIKNRITNAIVRIEASNGENFEFEEDSTESGVYKSKIAFAGQIGINYTLIVNFDFNNDNKNETYKASSTMLPHLPIDSINFNYQKILGYHIYSLKVYGQIIKEEKYILINYKINGVAVTPNMNQWLTFDSKFINNDYINGVNLISTSIINTIIDKKDKEKCSKTESKSPIYVELGDTITVLLSQIEEGYYNYIKQCKATDRSENPIWGGNNANITTNLSGGALGYFSTRSIIKKSYIIR
jgi:hypothetical protein